MVWVVAAVMLVAGVVVASALVVRRGGADAATTAASADPPGGVRIDRAGGSKVGDLAPEFTAVTLNGEQFRLPAGKPAVVFFMAGWCASCFPEAQALARVDSRYGDRVAILAVSPDPSDTPDSLRDFSDQAGARYRFARDSDGTLAGALDVRALDSTVVVDAAGRIVYRDGYPTDEATLLSALRKGGLR